MRTLLTILALCSLSFGQTTIFPKTTVFPKTTIFGAAASGNTFSLAQTSVSGTNGGSGTTVSKSFGANPTSGNMVVAYVNSAHTTSTVTISNTGTATMSSWSQMWAGDANADTNGCVQDIAATTMGWLCAWYATVTSGGTLTVTGTITVGGTAGMLLQEWHASSGFAATPRDIEKVSNGNSGFNTACTSGASSAVAAAGELNLGIGLQAAVVTWTPTGSLTTNDISLAIGSDDLQLAYNLSSGTGAQTYSFTMSGSSNWICGGAAFKHN